MATYDGHVLPYPEDDEHAPLMDTPTKIRHEADLDAHDESPLAYHRFTHGGQDAPYLWDRLRATYRGVPSGEVFPTRSKDWGHDGTRVTSTSHYSGYTAGNHSHGGVPSAIVMLGENVGHPTREYSYSRGGPTNPYDYGSKGVGAAVTPLADPGVGIDEKPKGLDHAFQRVNEWNGVPSAKAL